MKIAIVGLGYVGLPLAIELAKYFDVIGFDINSKRIAAFKEGIDLNGEVEKSNLESTKMSFTDNAKAIAEGDIVIVAVPTPIDQYNIPDLTPLLGASKTVGQNLKEGAIVCFESTVFPGTTEDHCIPILEKESSLVWKDGFFVGYSPERINPGDKVNTFTTIIKVVSGDTPETLNKLAKMYGTAVKAGIYEAESIKVAEASKVIENTQRDINIAIVNELRVIFDKMGISTKAVLEAAGSKWNFLKFTPGIVGGHCIGVDPYYLASVSELIGHYPGLIRAARRINDSMGQYFADEVIREMIERELPIKRSNVLLMGITFKENVPDIRNSKVIDIYHQLTKFGINVDIVDPQVVCDKVEEEYGIRSSQTIPDKKYDAVVFAVPHREYCEMGEVGMKALLKENGFFFDMKQVFA